MMKDYEVTDLFEAGNAGKTIEAKECACVDEISGVLGPSTEDFEESSTTNYFRRSGAA